MPDRFKRICVIGLGYVGLPTAAMFAARGLDVVGVDIRPDVVDQVNRGLAYSSEPDVDGLVHGVVQHGRLRATLTPPAADAFVVAVQTPLRDDRSPDISFVEAAVRSIAPVLQSGNVVILEATCPVGTTERVSEMLAGLRPDLRFPRDGMSACDINVCYCPERILPGRIVAELVDNDRIMGGMTPQCADAAAALYGLICKGACVTTTARTAELVKLAENAYRDVNIAFANELSVISAELGINVWDVVALANRHPRVDILRPGPGVGGHCIAVDPWFIVASAPKAARLIPLAREVNDSKQEWVVQQIRDTAHALGSPTIACLGLTYKADVDDLRESPALRIVSELALEYGEKLVVVEPNINELPEPLRGRDGICFATQVDRAIEAAELVVLLVDHTEFRRLDLSRLDGKIVIDTRNCWPALRQRSSGQQGAGNRGSVNSAGIA